MFKTLISLLSMLYFIFDIYVCYIMRTQSNEFLSEEEEQNNLITFTEISAIALALGQLYILLGGN